MAKDSLKNCPNSIKECLDWLIMCGNGNGATELEKAIKKVLPDFESNDTLKALIDAVKHFTGLSFLEYFGYITVNNNGKGIMKSSDTYTSAYSSHAKWKEICHPKRGTTKCCESNGTHNCSKCSGTSSCDGCCSNCPKQICARIFCLIVPVLWNVLSFLKIQCDGDWGTQHIRVQGSSATSLNMFMEVCGYDTSQLGDLYGWELIAEAKLDDVLTRLNDVSQMIYELLAKLDNKAFCDPDLRPPTTVSAFLPSTFHDILLWLQFLPYSSQYKNVLESFKEELGDRCDNKLKSLIGSVSTFGCFMWNKEGMKTNIFDKVERVSKCKYLFDGYNDVNKSVTIICLIIPVFNRVFNSFKEKCMGSWRSSSIKNDEDISRLWQSFGMQIDQVRDHVTTDDLVNNGEMLADIVDNLEELQDSLESSWATTYMVYDAASSARIIMMGTKVPTTIREMMLWLTGLSCCKGFEGLKRMLEEHCDKLRKTHTALNWDDFIDCLANSISHIPSVFVGIEGTLGHYIKDFMEGCVGEDASKRFKYEINAAKLYEQLLQYIYCTYRELRFLYEMCKETQDNGGWRSCSYGNGNPSCSNCNSNSNAGRKKCQQPLQNYLIDDDTHNKFKLCYEEEPIKMGFTKSNLIAQTVEGSELQGLLEDLFDETSKSLYNLIQYLVSMQQRMPESLGDMFECFRKINGGVTNNTLMTELAAEITGYNATMRVKMEEIKFTSELKHAIASITSEASHAKQDDAAIHSISNLLAISGCQSGKCVPFMKPICSGIYQYYIPRKSGSETWLDWFFRFGIALYEKLEALKYALEDCKCCPNGYASNITTCSGIVECPHCFPQLYKAGLIFGNTSKLNLSNDKRKCYELTNKLTQVLDQEAPLYQLCTKILDAVWSILLHKALSVNQLHFTSRDEEGLRGKYEIYLSQAFGTCSNYFAAHYLHKGMKGYLDDLDDHAASTTISPRKITDTHVLSITPIVPSYNPPHVDPFHYIDYSKGTNRSHRFADAVNFHILKSQCITPAPYSLRSITDWLLRLTVGDLEQVGQKNHLLKQFSSHVAKSLGSHVSHSDIQYKMKCLVEGLRKFVGYDDATTAVTRTVEEELKKVKTSLAASKIKVDDYLKDTQNYGKELGAALLQSTYKVDCKNSMPFAKLITQLEDALNSHHVKCPAELGCTAIQGTRTTERFLPEGLKELYRLLNALKSLVSLREGINRRTGDKTTDTEATNLEAKISKVMIDRTASPVDANCFEKVKESFKKLGECANKVQTLNSNHAGSDALKTSKDNLNNVINSLQIAIDTINIVPLSKMLKAKQQLIKLTKENVQNVITRDILKGLASGYQNQKELSTQEIINTVIPLISNTLHKYSHHLSDLQTLCLWLHRLAQLLKDGLFDFIRSLVDHLKHIREVISWLEHLQRTLPELQANATGNAGHESTTTTVLMINQILSSYLVVGTKSPKESESRTDIFKRLRWLALDCYTLQNWVDHKDHIKSWIMFDREGILKPSNLDGLKKALAKLAVMDYIPRTASNSGNRIFDFHAICVVQKFNHEEPLKRLVYSLDKLCTILELMKKFCPESNEGQQAARCITTIQSNDRHVQRLHFLVEDFLNDDYGVYAFARFLGAILGPNHFSAVIHSMKHLKDLNFHQNDGGHTISDPCRKTLEAMVRGLDTEYGPRTLEDYINRLTILISKLHEEYIFQYPVVGYEATSRSEPSTSGAPSRRKR